MKVIHVPFCIHPDPIGGTEVYVESLCRHFRAQGVQVCVAAPGDRNAEYAHGSLRVRRFEVGPAADLSDLYGGGDRTAALAFGNLVEEERPDLVHLHAFTRGSRCGWSARPGGATCRWFSPTTRRPSVARAEH